MRTTINGGLVRTLISAAALTLALTGASALQAQTTPTKTTPTPAAKTITPKPAAPKPAPAATTPAPHLAPVDINHATAAELIAIPGIGDAYAAKIIAGRPYANKSQLVAKKVLTSAVYKKVSARLIAKQ